MRRRLAFLLFIGGTLAANPVGKGLLRLAPQAQVLGRSHKGYKIYPPRADFEYASESEVGLTGVLILPVGEAFSASANAGFSQGKSSTKTFSGSNALGYSSFDYGESYGAGLRCYTGVFTQGRFNDAAQGNPDGYLWWPSVGFGLSQGYYHNWDQINEARGIFAGTVAPPRLETRLLGGSLSVLLPVHRRCSLSAGWSRDISAHQDSGSSSTDFGGAYQAFSANAELYLPLFFHEDHGDPDDYFPGLGWAGEADLNLGYQQGLNIDSSRRTFQGLSVSVATPLNSLLAAELGYAITLYDSSNFGSISGLTTTSVNTDPQRVYGNLTLSFGGF